jgi:hypothetical protein
LLEICFDAWTPCAAHACIYALTEMMQLQFFTTANSDRFYECHANRQGIAVLAFDVDSVDAIHSKYEALHPKLIWTRNDYGSTKILEVFAYYSNSNDKDVKEADQGTILRFVERDHTDNTTSVLPRLVPVHAAFDQPSQPAYCDHWVSNVDSQTDFLSTLHDTLGFVPKVDFNAGVVAAGEAQSGMRCWKISALSCASSEVTLASSRGPVCWQHFWSLQWHGERCLGSIERSHHHRRHPSQRRRFR